MEFFKNIYRDYLSVNLSDYKNININLDINMVILGLTIALTVICFLMYKRQTLIEALFKKLKRCEAYGKEKAVTLKSLGLCEKRFRKLLTNRQGNLKPCIVIIGEKKPTYNEYLALEKSAKNKKSKAEINEATPEEVDAETSAEENKEQSDIFEKDGLISCEALFYIPEDKIDLADRILVSNTTTLAKTIISCALILCIGIALIIAMPSILSALNSAL